MTLVVIESKWKRLILKFGEARNVVRWSINEKSISETHGQIHVAVLSGHWCCCDSSLASPSANFDSAKNHSRAARHLYAALPHVFSLPQCRSQADANAQT